MRVLLFTGKGGVGKSTVAAGTAAVAAASGQRTLVLSTDAAHSLADAYGVQQIGSEPTEVAPHLFVEQIDAQERFEQSWADIQRYSRSVFSALGVDEMAAEELSVIPGAEEVFALLELRRRAQEGTWDAIVVDCAPTAETLRLLALPEALGWYMQKLLPIQRRVTKALSPVLNRATGVPMPGDSVFDAIERLHDELLEVHELLSGPDASVRLVLTPETVVLAEARRSWTTLSLYGYTVDGVVANRVFPADGADQWRAGWVKAQQDVLSEAVASFAGLPLWQSTYRDGEPVGVDALVTLAEDLYDGQDPLARIDVPPPFRISRGEHGTTLRLALPGAVTADVQLGRHRDDLVVTVGSYRRVLTLPAGLARLEVVGARVVDGELRVRFTEFGQNIETGGTAGHDKENP